MTEISDKYKVLFVCLGNICRSPAAQGIFEHIVRENGMTEKIAADSAGLYEAMPVSIRTVACVRPHFIADMDLHIQHVRFAAMISMTLT